jgi:hypothetical protein
MLRPDIRTRLGRRRRRTSAHSLFNHWIQNFFHCVLLTHHFACRLVRPCRPPFAGRYQVIRSPLIVGLFGTATTGGCRHPDILFAGVVARRAWRFRAGMAGGYQSSILPPRSTEQPRLVARNACHVSA